MSPKEKIILVKESNQGISGLKGQRYLCVPCHDGNNDRAGIGISLGTNGIVIFEHSKNHFPALLVYNGKISINTKITVVFSDRTPTLYINGKIVRKGKKSKIKYIHPSGILGGSEIGFFIGELSNYLIWNFAKSEHQILSEKNHLSQSTFGLFGFWKLNEIEGYTVIDYSINKNHGEIKNFQNKKKLKLYKYGSNKNSIKRDTILLVSPGSQYNVTRYFVMDLANAFKEMGYRVLIFDFRKTSERSNLIKFVEINKNKIFFILGMNGWGQETLFNKISKNMLGFPFFSFLLDHPFYHINRLNFNVNSRDLIVSCVDKTHVDYLNTTYKNNYQKLFIPQGSYINEKIPMSLPLKERNIEILFAGTFINPDTIRSQWKNNPIYSNTLDNIVEKAIYQHKVPLTKIADETFKSIGLENISFLNKDITNLLVQADHYIRARRRLETLNSLVGLPIKVFNEDWNFFNNKGKMIIRPKVDFLTLQEHISRSRIVLNVLPNYYYGGHERIFTSMLANSVSLTDRNQYLETNFVDGENIALYDIGDKNLGGKVHGLLSDIDRLQEIASNGKIIANKHHTWKKRAEQIITGVNNHYKLFDLR